MLEHWAYFVQGELFKEINQEVYTISLYLFCSMITDLLYEY